MNRAIACLLVVAVFLCWPAFCQGQAPGTYTVTTVAGNGTAGSDGDGSAASAAEVNYPFGLALDTSGNLYIADQLNHKIRKLATDGTISTVAGTGTAGYSGDGALATSANMYTPCGVAVDQAGNLYIAATGNHVIRKVSTTGTISTIAGTGGAGATGNDGPATDAQLNTPVGVAVDAAGNIYIADTGNNQVRKVSTDGTITALAGLGSAGGLGDGGDAKTARLNRPEGVAVDASGNVYIADTSNYRVRKVATDGTISTVAGNGIYGDSGDGGQATQASLRYPKSVAVDPSGRLYILDAYTGRVRMVGTDGIINTIAGSGMLGFRGDGGEASLAEFVFPSGLVREASGRIYVADTANSRIRLLTPDTQAGGASGGLPTIVAGSVISASAFGAFTSIAPGSWIEIHGSNLASSAREWTMADFSGLTAPTDLDGTKVTIGGQAAFLSYVGPDQVNAQVPSGIQPGLRELTVTTPAGTSTPYTIAVNPTQAGLLAPASFRVSGNQYVAAVSGDGTVFIAPSGAVDGIATRPARPGEIITIYAVGGGPVAPDVKAGDFVEELTSLSSRVEISFDQTPAQIVWAGLSPGSIGLYQFNVVVPDVADGEAVPLRINLGGVGGGQTLNIAVKR